MNMFLITGTITEINKQPDKTANIEVLTKSGIHKIYFKQDYIFNEGDKIVAWGTMVPYQVYTLMYASRIIRVKKS